MYKIWVTNQEQTPRTTHNRWLDF